MRIVDGAICTHFDAEFSVLRQSLCAPAVGVQIAFYFLHGNHQVAFCFFLSCFFTKSRTAAIATYLWVFISAIFAQQLLSIIIVRSRWFLPIIELIPTFAIFRCASSHIPGIAAGGAHTRAITLVVEAEGHVIVTSCVPPSNQRK
jgi:hypothetical protein